MGSGQAGPHTGEPENRSIAWATSWTPTELTGARTLIPAILSTSIDLRGRRWWARFPFLPLPDPVYTKWRLTTAYGRNRIPSFRDLATFASWRQSMRRLSRGRRP